MNKTSKNTKKAQNRPQVFDMTSNQCVWARTGLMAPFPCMNAFNCLDCSVDRQMQRQIVQRKTAALVVRSTPEENAVAPGKCRHMLSGRVSYKYCMNQYDCAACEFHQTIEAETLHQPVTDASSEVVAGFAVARRYYHHRGHAWARIEYGGRVRVGMDDFSMRLLGPMDTVKLPPLGTTVTQGGAHVDMFRDNLNARVRCPVDGIVVAVNPRVMADAALPNQAPYDTGWLMIIEPTRLKRNLKNLMFQEESLAWIEEESSRLTELVAKESGFRLAATGGRAVSDIFGQMPELGWQNLVSTFLLATS